MYHMMNETKSKDMNEVIFKTNATSPYCKVKADVRITDMKVCVRDAEYDLAELRVYFDPSSYDVAENDYIYLDNRFLRDVRNFLKAYNLPTRSIDYTEYMMQTDEYVSLHCDLKFVRAFEQLTQE
jgi:hypothetical protein